MTIAAVHKSVVGNFRKYPARLTMSVDRGKADLALGHVEVSV